jgi:hypothetical protein
MNWNPAADSPLPLVLDRSNPKAFTSYHAHPNLPRRAVWDSKNWQEPQGMYFYGWRFENRDEDLDRWLAATFEWEEVGGPDRVIGTVIPGISQAVIVGIEPPNGSATIEFRAKSANNYSSNAPQGLRFAKVPGAPSRWQLAHTLRAGNEIVARITAPHIALEVQAGFDAKVFELGLQWDVSSILHSA